MNLHVIDHHHSDATNHSVYAEHSNHLYVYADRWKSLSSAEITVSPFANVRKHTIFNIRP
jgi:hypothetical protein